MLQKDIEKLLALIVNDKSLRVEIETNGAVALDAFCKENRPHFTMDYKLPSSECEKFMVMDNFGLLGEDDVVKFVSESIQDLEKAYELIRKYKLTERCHVYFSPVFGSIEPVEIVDFMIKNNINSARLQIQMHKVIWNPDERGV